MSDTPYTDKHSLGFSPLVEDRWMHEGDARKLEQRCNDLEKAMSYSSRSITLLSKFLQAIKECNEARDMVEKLTEQGLAMMDENRMLKRQIKELKKKYE